MNCPLCKSSNIKNRYSLDSHIIAKCNSCSTLFNLSFFAEEKFRNKLFEKKYYEEVQSEAFKNKLDLFQNDPSYHIYKKNIKKISSLIKEKKVLDVGCAFGNFLKVAETEGWLPYGVEISKHASSAAREHWGYEIFNGDLNDCLFNKDSFDLVTFWDVIEHVSDPKGNLEKANSLLKKDGYLLITTDNFNSLISFIANIIYYISFKKIGYAINKFYIPYNTFYFNKQSAKRLLEATGFKIAMLQGIDYPIEKLNLSFLERFAVKMLYFFGNILKCNSQILIWARKK